MEELKKELEKLSKAYVDTPENEEKILIPFVKRLLELPMKERRKLLPVIRDLQWIKSKFAGFSSETTCSAARAHFLSAVQFVCANKREMDMAYHVKFDMLCKLLPLYYPTWLTDFINDDKTWFNFDLNYEQLMQLMDMGYLKEIAPSRIAHVLPWITRIRNKEPKGNDTFNSELLLKRDITLKEHIWTIFEYESSTGYQDDCAKEAYKKGVTARDESISAALYRFSLDGHLDRERLLKATLATFHRSFKKDMAGWFAGFFETLQPTTGELLSLQEEMMQIFTSSYTKPVNVMLQQLKNIASEEGSGVLIDTPGVREFGLVIDNPDSLAEVLEISDYAESCRFKDCKHINEPGCAVLEAVNSGVLDYKVYASYLKLRREAWHFSASEHEKRKKEKSFTKLVEEVKNRKANR